MWCLQFSNKLNGGNQVLYALYSKIYSSKTSNIIYLKKNPIKTIIFIIFYSRNTPIIVSDPFCSILLWLAMRSKVIHFVQSDDLTLFRNHGYLFNFIYKIFYKLMALNNNWFRIFNSDYSIIYFAKRFGINIDKSLIVPMLGINQLFPLINNKYKLKKNGSNFIWLGSQHSFKGGKLFIRAVNISGSQGHMVFNGYIPSWAKGHSNISVEANLKREIIFTRIRKHAALIYTSSFDSFALPIFEALLIGRPVIAIKNKCIELNQSTDYVTLVSDVYELSTKMAGFNELNIKPKVQINWALKHQEFNKWCDQIKVKINICIGVI